MQLSRALKVICQRLLGRDKEEKQNQKSEKKKEKKKHFMKAKPFECSESNLSTVYLADTWEWGDAFLFSQFPLFFCKYFSKFPATFIILLL